MWELHSQIFHHSSSPDSSCLQQLLGLPRPCKLELPRAPVAQMDRAIASGAIGREFESLRAHQ